jgi:hypothetical protein
MVRSTVLLLGTLKGLKMGGNKGIKGKEMEKDEEDRIEVKTNNKMRKNKVKKKIKKDDKGK